MDGFKGKLYCKGKEEIKGLLMWNPFNPTCKLRWSIRYKIMHVNHIKLDRKNTSQLLSQESKYT